MCDHPLVPIVVAEEFNTAMKNILKYKKIFGLLGWGIARRPPSFFWRGVEGITLRYIGPADWSSSLHDVALRPGKSSSHPGAILLRYSSGCIVVWFFLTAQVQRGWGPCVMISCTIPIQRETVQSHLRGSDVLPQEDRMFPSHYRIQSSASGR